MIVECDHCHAKYRYDEARLAGKPSKKLRCSKCKSIFEVFNTRAYEAQPAVRPPIAPDETVNRHAGRPREDTTRETGLGATNRERAPTPLKLPASLKLSLAVIAGPDAGKIFVIDKPRVVIGREDVDLVVEDPEISRQHAALEISGEDITLLDLGSTNGTLVGEQPISQVPLENQGEFTIGGSTLMLIVTPAG